MKAQACQGWQVNGFGPRRLKCGSMKPGQRTGMHRNSRSGGYPSYDTQGYWGKYKDKDRRETRGTGDKRRTNMRIPEGAIQGTEKKATVQKGRQVGGKKGEKMIQNGASEKCEAERITGREDPSPFSRRNGLNGLNRRNSSKMGGGNARWHLLGGNKPQNPGTCWWLERKWRNPRIRGGRVENRGLYKMR